MKIQNHFNKIFKILLTFIILFGLYTPTFTKKIEAVSPDHRLAGADRFETAVKISNEGWKQGAQVVVIARGDVFADALSGTPLAYQLNAPILLTKSSSLPRATKDEIVRLKAKKAIILGGFQAITEDVKKELSAIGITTIERISGVDRYSTSAAISRKVTSDKSKAVIATGESFPDALAIAPYAAKNKYPILLTKPNQLPKEVKDLVSTYKSTMIVGGTVAVSNDVQKILPKPERIAGATRYETAEAIIRSTYQTNEKLYISTGSNFADALTGSILAAKNKTAILLVDNKKLQPGVDQLFAAHQVKGLKVFGGQVAVPDSIVDELLVFIKNYAGTVGAVGLNEKVKTASTNQISALKSTTKIAANDNGTVTYQLTAQQAGQFKKDEILYIQPTPDYPTGFIGKVMMVNSAGNVTLGQPAVDEVFDNFDIDVQKKLTTSDLVNVNLSEGVKLVANNQEFASFKDYQQALHQRTLTHFSPLEDKPFTLSFDKQLIKNTSVKGEFVLNDADTDVDLEKTLFGEINAFDFSFNAKPEASLMFTGKWEGSFPKEDEKREQGKNFYGNDWISVEGVDRNDRIPLASVTYQVGTVAPFGGPGNHGFKPVGLGVTVFITVNLKGEANFETKIGFSDEYKLTSGIEWKDEDFSSHFNMTKETSKFNLDGKGEAKFNIGTGVEPALNIGGLLPAVIQNDLTAKTEIKGNFKFDYDLVKNEPNYKGCFESNLSLELDSILKARLMATSKKIETGTGFEYEKKLYNLPIFKKDKKMCTDAGVISGTTLDAVTGKGIPGVEVKAIQDGSLYKSTISDENGDYKLELEDGKYDFTYAKLLYKKEEYYNVKITKDETFYSPELHLIGEAFYGNGNITGIITDAMNGEPVEDVKINFRKGLNSLTGTIVKSAQSDEDGGYAATLDAGMYTAEIVKTGYVTGNFNVTSIGGRTNADQNASISPIIPEDEIRIVMRWQNEPEDLDAHLTGPTLAGGQFHIYFDDMEHYENEELFAGLDIDDTDYDGPETITIKKQVPGTYTYAVHNYTETESTNSTTLSKSAATVVVYKGNRLIKTFNVPTNQNGKTWTVFQMVNGQIQPINKITDEWYDANGVSTLSADSKIYKEKKKK